MSKSADRLPPHAQEIEAAFIGCLILDAPNCMGEAMALGACADWFYDLRHQTLFKLIGAMVDALEPVDLVTLCQKLDDLGTFGGKGGTEFLIELTQSTPSASNLGYYAGILKEKALARRTIQVCTQLVSEIYEQPANIGSLIERAETSILSISQLDSQQETPSIRDLAIAVTHNIEARLSGNTGCSTGFYDIDKWTNGGLQPADLWIVAARPSAGKTGLAMNIADNVATRFKSSWASSNQSATPYTGETVVVFSLEMTAESLTERLVASKARVCTRREPPATKAEPGVSASSVFNDGEMRKINLGVSAISKLPLVICDRVPLTVAGIRARARRYYSKNKARFFIIDYLQLISSDGFDSDRRVQVDAISRGLKLLAKELRVPVLVLAQLNRDIEKDGKARKPRMSDLRESGQIEQDADLIGFLYPDPETKTDSLKPSDPRTIFFRIGKQRNGVRDFDIPLTFFPDIVTFETQARKSPPEK